MQKTIPTMLLILTAAFAAVATAQISKYPPIEQYLMPRADEITLAKTAAPKNISDAASIKILTKSGYEDATQGTNGFVCMVLRGFAAPTFSPVAFRDLVYDASVRAPICFTALAAREVIPYYELRTTLALQGKDPDQISSELVVAFASGKLPARSQVSFAYMWSAHQMLGPGIDHWHPHMMVFAPYYNSAMLGNNPFGAALPQVVDDPDTPFSVLLIPVDEHLAVSSAALR